MTENLLAITENPIAYDYIYNPVAVMVDSSLNDSDFEWSDADATTDTMPLYQLSKDYTTEVTFYDASENQTVTATVILGVTLTLNLNVASNETIYSNICYSGNWEYSTSVNIIWGDDCPWDNTEKARQRRLVEDSIYVESLNVKLNNTKNICHYDKNNHAFMVEFAEGNNTLDGEIVIASTYTPTYTIVVDNVQNSANGPSDTNIAVGTTHKDVNDVKKKSSQVEITSVSIDTRTIVPNKYNVINCSTTIKVVVPTNEDEYTITFTLSANRESEQLSEKSANGKSKQLSDKFSVIRTKIENEEKVKIRYYGKNTPFEYSLEYDQKLENAYISVKVGNNKKNFISKLYQPGTQDYILNVSVNAVSEKTTQTITVSEYTGSCWANVFLVMNGLDTNSSNFRRLYSNLYEGAGNGNITGGVKKTLEQAGIPCNNPEDITILKIVEKLNNNFNIILYNGDDGGHFTLVTGYSQKDEKIFFQCYDTSNSSGWNKSYEAISIDKGVKLGTRNYSSMYYISKSDRLTQSQFESKFPLKTEFYLETTRNDSQYLLPQVVFNSSPVYSHTFTNANYSDVYITNLCVAFGSNATLINAWLREGTTVGIMDGASISNSWIQDDSSLFLYSGSELSGTLTVSGKLTAEGSLTLNDVEIELDISGLDVNNVGLVDGVDYLKGASWSVWTNDSQNEGTYLLADNVSSFDTEININSYGNIHVGETLTIGLANYTLNLSDSGELTLTITYDEPEDGIAPTIPIITEVITAQNDVSLNWQSSSDLNGIDQYVLFYSLNESFWEADYVCATDTTATISGLQDGVYYMRVCAVDTYGNKSDYSETQRVQVGPPEISVKLSESDIFLNRYQSEQRNYIFTSEIKNDSDIDINDLYVKVLISDDEFYGSDDYMLGGLSLAQLKAGETQSVLLKFNIPEQYLTGDYHIGIVASDYTEDYQYQVEDWVSFNGENELEYYGTDVLLPNVMPQAEYMYGCTPTALGMLLGYYDLYGYRDKDFSNLIEGDIDIYSRGTDGDIYNMNAFDTVLGRFIASEDYVYRFFSREELSVITSISCSSTKKYRETTPTEELAYSFVDGGNTFDTSVWNCLADYIGTGQYWRGQPNLSTAMAYNTLENIIKSTSTSTFTGDGYSRTIDYKYTTLLYGLNLYVESRGYELNTEMTGTYATDNNGGSFTFEDYMREIDAGRPVIISITDHSMVGYGYNAKTKEIIFDDDYAADQRMVWGGSYYYSGQNRNLQSITVLAFRTQPGNRDLAFDGTVQLANQELSTNSSFYFFEGNSIYLSFNVINNGPDPSYSFKIAVKVDGYDYEIFDVNKLAGNEIRQYKDLRLDGLTAGTHQINVILDTKDTVEESTNTNNNYSTVVQVLPEGMQILSSSITLSTGQSASNTLIAASGCMTLDGGRTEDILLQGNSTGSEFSYYDSRGRLIVKNGGIVKDVEAFNLGYIDVSSGGKAEDVILHSSGNATVYSGGSVSGLSVKFGGNVFNYGGSISDAILAGRVYFKGSQGGKLSSATVNAYFLMSATGGAVASKITVGSMGAAYIYSGAVLKDVSGEGYLYAASDGVIQDAEIQTGGYMGVGNGGRTEDVVLHSRTSQDVYSGATAIRTSAMGGWINVSSGGIVSSALIGNGGSMSLREGAKAYNLTVEQGGVVYSWPLGYMYGNLTIGGRVQDINDVGIAGVSSYFFNVQTQMDDAFLSFSSGGIGSNSIISIDVGNAWGDYTLIKGDLTNLSSATISIKSNGFSASISASGAKTLGDGRNVKLTKGTDEWTLTVSGTDNTPPHVPGKIISEVIDNTLYITWQAVQDFSGVKYEVEYSRNADFSASASELVTASGIELPLANGLWHWRVRAVDGAGNTSPWSNAGESEIHYTKMLNGPFAQTQSAYSDVSLAQGATVNATYPGGVQLLDNGFTVTLLGNNTLICRSIRNAAILFGEDASWGDYYDGTVNFIGTNITLHSEVSNCITAAGIRGNNLTVNFADKASGAESILFEASNGSSGPGNYAAGVEAEGNLIVNGNFGGTISCVMDNSNLTSKRWGSMEGFYANGNLEFNGDMDGQIYLAGYSTSASYAYGMYSYENLTMNGDIGGIIMATAENSAYGLYGYESITASISGIVFAGKTTDDNDLDTLSDKLKHFSENKAELLELSQGQYSVYTQGQANLTLSDDALLIGNLRVGSGSQITISGGASIYGDITTYYTTGLQLVLDNDSIEGTRLTTTNWNNRLTLSVNADDLVTNGTYSLVEANDLSSISAVALSVGGQSYNLQMNNSVKVAGITYALAKETVASKQTLTLTVTGSNVLPAPKGLSGNSSNLTWLEVAGASGYVAEYSHDNFATCITVDMATTGLEHYNIDAGTWKWRVRAKEGTAWAVGNDIVISSVGTVPTVVQGNANGVKDAFFVKAMGTWNNEYRARHMGVHGGWAGTGEKVVFSGENRFADIFQGSTDENVLLLTDDANGDALFVYDTFTESNENMAKSQSRLANIKEIRAGAGNDIVDMTSDAFDYTGGGLSIYGGLGNDTIWANSGNNTLFGDAGNDRIVGAGGNDVIVGGAGDDSMHGGGGDDIFAFGGNWGNDSVEQLADGKVTLWFDSGSAAKWNASTLTYTDGDKSVHVSGVTASAVTLKFGDDGSQQYDKLLADGAFDEFCSEKIFENKNTRGMLA